MRALRSTLLTFGAAGLVARRLQQPGRRATWALAQIASESGVREQRPLASRSALSPLPRLLDQLNRESMKLAPRLSDDLRVVEDRLRFAGVPIVRLHIAMDRRQCSDVFDIGDEFDFRTVLLPELYKFHGMQCRLAHSLDPENGLRQCDIERCEQRPQERDRLAVKTVSYEGLHV